MFFEQQNFEAMSKEMNETISRAIRAASHWGRDVFDSRFPSGRFECCTPGLAGEWKLESVQWNPTYSTLQFAFSTEQVQVKRRYLSSAELDKALANGTLKYLPPRAEG